MKTKLAILCLIIIVPYLSYSQCCKHWIDKAAVDMTAYDFTSALTNYQEALKCGKGDPQCSGLNDLIATCNKKIKLKKDYDSYREKALASYNDSDYVSALSYFQSAKLNDYGATNDVDTWINKCNFVIYLKKGIASFKSGSYSVAEENFTKAKELNLSSNPSTLTNWINKCGYYKLRAEGMAAYDKENYTAALENFNKAGASVFLPDTNDVADWINKCNYQILYKQGITAYKSGSYTEAEGYFKKAKEIGIATYSVELSKWMNLCGYANLRAQGIEAYNKENYTMALETFNKVKELNFKPDTFDIDDWIVKCNYSIDRAEGISKYKEKNFFDALENFNKAKNSVFTPPNGDIGKWIDSTMVNIEKIAWIRLFDVGENADANSVVRKNDGGYVVAGNTLTSGGVSEIFLLSTDYKGNKLWKNVVSNKEKISSNILRITKDNGFVVAGSIYNSEKKNSDFYIAKIDKNGSKEWEKSYARDGNEEAKDIQETADQGYIITGNSSVDTNKTDIYLMKTNSKGEKEWDKTMGEEGKDFAVNCFQSDNGGYVIAGNTESYKADKQDILIFKTDDKGNIDWVNVSMFGGAKNDEAEKVLKTDDGGYIISGYTQSYGPFSKTVYLVKTNEKGIVEWHYIYGDKEKDNICSISLTKENGYLLVGETLSAENGKKGVYIIKTDSTGKKLWEKKYNKTVDYNAKSVVQAENDGFIISGNTKSAAGTKEIFLMKIDKSGNVIF